LRGDGSSGNGAERRYKGKKETDHIKAGLVFWACWMRGLFRRRLFINLVDDL